MMATKSKLDWIHIGSLQDIPAMGARVVTTQEGDIAVFRTAKNEVFALRDECPHKKGKLSQGIVHDRSVTCPLHNWVLDLMDGQAKGPDVGCAVRFPVKLEGERILLSVSPME